MRVYLAALKRLQGWQLAVVEDPLREGAPTRVPADYRLSPIYALRPDLAELPSLAETPIVGLVSYDRPFNALPAIHAALNHSDLGKLWISIGLCSLVVFADTPGELEHVLAEGEDTPRSVEVWRVGADGDLTVKSVRCAEPARVDPQQYALGSFQALNSDHTMLLTELQHSLHKCVAKAARHLPSQLPVYAELAKGVSTALEELRFLCNPHIDPPEWLTAVAESLRDDSVARQKRLNLLTDQIVQLNSALSYVNSQAYHGASPVLDNACLYQGHSLLGIGCAFKGLAVFTRFVEDVFRRYPIDETIKQKYGYIAGTDVCRHIRDYGEGNYDWRKSQLRIDTHMVEPLSGSTKLHLVFYSGRLGFQESHFAVTAPMQVLNASNTVRWSLMTLTHELTHAHVRALLGAIFASTSPWQLSEAAFEDYYADYEEYVRGKKPTAEWPLQAALRFAIFNYCSFRYSLEQLTGSTGSARIRAARQQGKDMILDDVYLPDREALLELWRAYFKSINEIIVHVLDYQYFYNATESMYIPLLWQSWATVPAVQEHLSDYILRTLVTVTAGEKGAPAKRFEDAVDIMRSALGDASSSDLDTGLLGEARNVLDDEERRKALRKMYVPALYLADVTMALLRSSRIHASLLAGDPNVRTHEHGYEYQINSGQWPGVDIRSPVAFVADRLRRSIGGEEGLPSVEHLSAWFFLACASASESPGDPTNG